MSSEAIREMAAAYQVAVARYWELTDAAIVAVANAVSKQKAELGIDSAVRDVADTLGEDWRVVLACFRTAHPNPAHPNPIAQDRDGSVRRELELSEEREPRLRDHFAIGDMAPCRVCGEELTPHGRTCERCERSIQYDRLERGDSI